MINIAIFASGRGTNFQAIVDAVKTGRLKDVKVSLLVCDRPQAAVLERAKKEKIASLLIQRESFKTKKDFEEEIIKHLQREKIDLVVLAGYMRILSPYFVNHYKNRIMNIHPALLPSFKGTEGIKNAFDYGVKITGVTVHFVDEQMDHGPIIWQEALKIEEDDTLESLEEKIHTIEHRIYPEAIRLFVEERLKIEGRKVKILSKNNK